LALRPCHHAVSVSTMKSLVLAELPNVTYSWAVSSSRSPHGIECSVLPKSWSLALESPRGFPSRENAPSLTVALPSRLNRLLPGVSWLAWSFFAIGNNGSGLGDLFLWLGLEDLAQARAHRV